MRVCVSSCLTRAPCPAHGAPSALRAHRRGSRRGVGVQTAGSPLQAGADSVVRQLYAKKSVFKKKVKVSGPYQLL